MMGINRGAAAFALHTEHDWCHLCGKRTSLLVDVWYPENAERETAKAHYIRICNGCLTTMAEMCRTAGES